MTVRMRAVHWPRWIIIAAALATLLASPAAAQAQDGVRGAVSDGQGLPLPGARRLCCERSVDSL